MSTADNWLGSPRPPVVLHLISDLQQSAAPLRFADLEPPPQTQLVLHDVGNAAAENVFIQGAQLTTVDTRSLEVTVRGAAAKPQQRQVVLSIDGKEYARRTVELPAGAVTAPAPSVEGEGSSRGARVRAASGRPAPSAKVLFPDLKLSRGFAPDRSRAGARRRLAAGRSVLRSAGACRSESVAGRARCAQRRRFVFRRGDRLARGADARRRRARARGDRLGRADRLLVAGRRRHRRALRYPGEAHQGIRRGRRLGARDAGHAHCRSSPDRCSKAGASASRSSAQLRSARSRRRIRCCAKPAIGILCASSDTARCRSAMTTRC